MTQTQPVTAEVPGDLRMAKRLWPFLLASTVSLIPFTVFGMYLVPIADAAGGSVAEIGGLRASWSRPAAWPCSVSPRHWGLWATSSRWPRSVC
jgi:hypothetical protein